MKYKILIFVVLAFGYLASVFAAGTTTTQPPATGSPSNLTLEQAADVIEERAFRGCESSSSALEGNPNRGRTAPARPANLQRGTARGNQ